MSEQPDEKQTCCCSVKGMCGRSLWYGVVYASIATLTLTVVMLLLATLNVSLIMCSRELPLNAQPLLAVDLVFALVIICLSVYQIIITALLLWQALHTKGKIFLCSVWYVSHLGIMTLYALFFCVRVATCFIMKHYFSAAVTSVLCIIYEGVIIYFMVVVNSYLHSLEHDRYF